MKKLFSLASALVVALAMNAQTYDFATLTFAESDFNLTNGTVTFDDAKGYYNIKNVAGETVVMTLAQIPNVEFSYKNSTEKDAFRVKSENYVQMNGDQRDLTIKNVAVGTMITLSVASKGSTANSFADSETKGTGLTGCVLVSGNLTQPAKADAMVFEEITVQAIAPTVIIRTTAGGYCLNKLVIGTESAVENVNADAVKARKVMENGQLYIIKNGVKYNALGTVVR